jgi:para-nitrobenzyl esterase
MFGEERGGTVLRGWNRILGTLAMLVTVLLTATAGWGAEMIACEGDCDGGDAVSVDEVITLVNIDLGTAQPSVCRDGVPGTGGVDIALILRAVKNSLHGCPLVVQLSDGTLRGDLDGASRRFLGIPYAAPPVGNLRWRLPQPSMPWTGTRLANDFGPSCSDNSGGAPKFSEDCLYLNVWTPSRAPTFPRPVMVWFHGGGNQVYSAAAEFFLGGLQYNGRTLAEMRDVIIVTINYRLGVFGFFPHPALATEDPQYPYAGNQGLLDQRAALQWVHDNIAAFGGDPGNVTIFGESAGSFDVCLHLVSPGSAGLFHRAISESNGCTTRQPTPADAAPSVDQLVAAVGCSGSADVLACLRQVPADALLGANPLGDAWASDNLIVDGGFLPDQPRALFAAGRFSKVPYIIGSNAEEGNEQFGPLMNLLNQNGFMGALQSLYGDQADQVAALYPPEDFPPTATVSSELMALARSIGDRDNICPTYDTARRAAAGGAPTYLYNFARPDSDPVFAAFGADHQAEIGYVFGSVDLKTDDNREVASAMQGYWTRLAAAGNPNGEEVVWPRYDDASDERLNLDVPITVVTGFHRTRCEFWWGLADQEFN